MDKDRVIELVDTLDKLYWQLYNNPNGMGGEPAIRYQIKLAHELIENELDSKTVMPQVFDDWYKSAVQLKKEHPDRDIDFFYGLANVYLDSFDAEKSWKDIAGWLRGDIDKYLMCIDAIRYGYEVEK